MSSKKSVTLIPYSKYVWEKKESKRVPLYIIVGDEDFLRTDLLVATEISREENKTQADLIDRPIWSLWRKLGGNKIYFREHIIANKLDFVPDTIWADVYSPPLFEEWNVIIVRSLEILEKGKRAASQSTSDEDSSANDSDTDKDSQDEEETDKKNTSKRKKSVSEIFRTQIEKFLIESQTQASSATLVLEINCSQQDLKGSKKFWQELAEKYPEQVIIITCFPLQDRLAPYQKKGDLLELESWVMRRYKEFFQKSIGLDACRELIQRMGNNPGGLHNELHNLYTKFQADLNLSHIQQAVKKTRKISPTDLWNSVMDGYVSESYRLLYESFHIGVMPEFGKNDVGFIEANSIAIILFSTLQMKLANIWNLLVDKKSPNFYEKNKVEEQVKYFSKESLIEIWQRLLDADIECKFHREMSPMIIHNLIDYIFSQHNSLKKKS